MTLSELIKWYQNVIKSVGKKVADEELYNLGYNRTMTSIVTQLHDIRGNEKPLLSAKKIRKCLLKWAR